jgi:hypothetical protein
MSYNKNENGLAAQNSAVQTPSVHETGKCKPGMNLEQLNEYLAKKAEAICEYERKKRTEPESRELMSIIEKQKETIKWQDGIMLSQARVIERLSVGIKQDDRCPDGPCKVIKMIPR